MIMAVGNAGRRPGEAVPHLGAGQILYESQSIGNPS